ncbi:MAG: hypothetical protein ACI9FD_004772 [Gammaproteobacteria bacterium]|jgi:hypothetical protein
MSGCGIVVSSAERMTGASVGSSDDFKRAFCTYNLTTI